MHVFHILTECTFQEHKLIHYNLQHIKSKKKYHWLFKWMNWLILRHHNENMRRSWPLYSYWLAHLKEVNEVSNIFSEYWNSNFLSHTTPLVVWPQYWYPYDQHWSHIYLSHALFIFIYSTVTVTQWCTQIFLFCRAQYIRY